MAALWFAFPHAGAQKKICIGLSGSLPSGSAIFVFYVIFPTDRASAETTYSPVQIV
jgi:hypothetical protein